MWRERTAIGSVSRTVCEQTGAGWFAMPFAQDVLGRDLRWQIRPKRAPSIVMRSPPPCLFLAREAPRSCRGTARVGQPPQSAIKSPGAMMPSVTAPTRAPGSCATNDISKKGGKSWY